MRAMRGLTDARWNRPGVAGGALLSQLRVRLWRRGVADLGNRAALPLLVGAGPGRCGGAAGCRGALVSPALVMDRRRL